MRYFKICDFVNLYFLNTRDILYVQTVHYVHSICMANRLWPAAVVYGEIALPAFKKYYGENSTYVAALLVRYANNDLKLIWVKLFL